MPKEKTPSSQDREKKNKRKREKREYYRRNKEEINAKNRKYYRRNKEEINDRRRRYDAEHREEKLESDRKRHNQEKIKSLRTLIAEGKPEEAEKVILAMRNLKYLETNLKEIEAAIQKHYQEKGKEVPCSISDAIEAKRREATAKKSKQTDISDAGALNKDKRSENSRKLHNQGRIADLLELIAAGKSEAAAATIRKMKNLKYWERNLKEIEAAIQKHYQEKGKEVPCSISDAIEAKRREATAKKSKQTDISDAGNDILPSSIEKRGPTPSYVPSPSESESNSDCPPYRPSKQRRGDSENGYFPRAGEPFSPPSPASTQPPQLSGPSPAQQVYATFTERPPVVTGHSPFQPFYGGGGITPISQQPTAPAIAGNAEEILSLLSMSTNLPDYFSKKMPSTPNQSLGTLDGLVDLPDDLIQALSRLPDAAESTPEPQLSEHLPTQQVYATFTKQIPVVTSHSLFQPFYGDRGITPISQQPTAPAIADTAEEILSLLSMSTNLPDYFSKKMPSTPNQSLGTLDGLVDLPDDFIKALSLPSASPASTQEPQLSEHLPAQRVYAPFTEQPPVVTGHSLFQPLFYGGGGQMQNQQPREPRVPTSAQPRYAVPPQQPVARQTSWQDRVTSRSQQPSTTDRPGATPFQGGFRLF